MAFSSDYETIATQLEETGELLQILRNKEEFPSEHFLYIRDPLERIMENVT